MKPAKAKAKVTLSESRFPRLYRQGSGGAMIQWDVWTEGANIVTQHGQVGGKLQTARKTAERKNTGRSNATTPEGQALIEAAAMHRHRLDRTYRLSVEEARKPIFLPMLAHNFEDQKYGLHYPVMMQPKLDGFRCLAAKEDGVVTLYSRSGDVFNLPHISEELQNTLPDDAVVDGELYRHGVTFQQISSWIKKNHPETKTLGMHLYDVPEMGGRADLTMEDRAKLLEVMAKHSWTNISIVPTVWVRSQSEVYEQQVRYVEDGYEGGMVRIPGERYRYNYRSYGLLKVKTFEDAEFMVVGGHRGIGSAADMCVFVCVTPEGRKFGVMPRGKASERKQYLKDLKKYIGKMLTVKYLGFTEEGKPKCAVGVGFRPRFDT